MQHDDDDATSLTLVLQGAIPTLTALDATALARVTRLELRDLTPTRAQLAALAQQLPSLEDVALVRCDVERLQPGEGAQAPAAPPLPSSVRALDVQWSTLGPLSADLDEADRQLTSANAVALSLLRSPGELRRLVATAPAESILGDVVALPALTHLSLVDAEFLLSGMRRLLDHPGLTHVELHHQHQPTWPVEPLREGFRWRELALVDTNGDNLPNVPLGKIDRVVFRHRVFDRRFGSEPSWGELVAAAGEAGAALACEPDGEGRFTVDMRLEDAVQVGEFEEWKRHRCLCYEDDYELDWTDLRDECQGCGNKPLAGWPEERARVRSRCFERAEETLRFVAQHLPDEGGPWHLVIKDCQWEEVDGARTLEDVLNTLPPSKVASWVHCIMQWTWEGTE